MEIFNYEVAQNALSKMLLHFSPDPVEALCTWMIESPDEVKHFVQLYSDAVSAAYSLETFLDK